MSPDFSLVYNTIVINISSTHTKATSHTVTKNFYHVQFAISTWKIYLTYRAFQTILFYKYPGVRSISRSSL